MLYGEFAIWQCNHCTELRVWGNVGPEDGRRIALLRCQASGNNELHTFIEMSPIWEGVESELAEFPTGGLPCRKVNKSCACR